MQPQKRLCSSPRGEKFSCVWGPAVFAASASNFPKWGEGARIPARRSAQPCAQGWTVYERRSPFFQLSFSLDFRSLCARVDRGRETRPRAPVRYRARTPSFFFARRRKWRRSRFDRLLSLPPLPEGGGLRSRGSCRHDSPPRPIAQGLRANFSTACSKVIFYYKLGNRASEFLCCSGFSSRDRA